MKNKSILINGLIAASLLSSTLLADGSSLYKRCSSCHGQKGEIVALGKSKVINQMSKSDFVKALKGYQEGTYGGPMKGLMSGQVKNLSNADMEAIADAIIK